MAEQPDIVRWAAGLLFIVLLATSLYVAKAILLPILASLVFTLVLIRAADWLGTLPVLGALSTTLRRFIVLVIMAGCGGMLGLVISGMLDRIAESLPVYEANIQALIGAQAARFGLDEVRLLEQVSLGLQNLFDLQSVSFFLISSAGSLTGTLLMIALYSGFLIAERGTLKTKLARAIGDDDKAHRARNLVMRISDSVSHYLATKTLINVLLATLSYGVLKLFSVDFALFWATLIGLLNYIPYVGSYIGVILPVILSLGQFGSLGTTISLAAALTIVQMLIGNLLEPWLLGRRVNLSPFVVLVSLVAWTSIWGLAGAILAVPLTSTIAIICAALPGLQPVAIMLSAGDDTDLLATLDER